MSRSARLAVAWAASLAAALLVPAVAGAVDVPPAAAFTITPNPATVGLPVVIEDHSGDLDGQITRREWDLNGDGTFELSNLPSVVRTFQRPRCVLISLRVTDSGGNIAQHNAMLTVRLVGGMRPVCAAPPPDPAPIVASSPPPPTPNNAPTATFVVSPDAPQIGQLVSFTSTASDSDGAVASQEWDLNGDGTFGDASGPTAQTTFTTAGPHNVSLRVSDDRGVLVVGTVPVPVVDPSAVAPGGSGVQGSRQRAPAQALDATVRLRTRVGVKRARVEILSVEAPANSTVTLRCSASRCPAALSVARVGSRERTVHFRRTENRLLYAGTLLQVFVTRPGSIGKYVSFRIRGEMSPPRRLTRCLRPGGMRPYRCP